MYQDSLTVDDRDYNPDVGGIFGPQNADFPLRAKTQGRTQNRLQAILSASVCLFDSQSGRNRHETSFTGIDRFFGDTGNIPNR